MTKVTVADFRKAKICPDAQEWFVQNNLNWREFVLRGIDAQELLDTGDQQDRVKRVIALAEERESS